MLNHDISRFVVLLFLGVPLGSRKKVLFFSGPATKKWGGGKGLATKSNFIVILFNRNLPLPKFPCLLNFNHDLQRTTA